MSESTVQQGHKFAVVIHEDDLGMCHGANAAFIELNSLGVCTSGSVMVPCPWFSEIVDLATAHPCDVGVHLTLNSEKKYYRWRPLEARSQNGGLVDSGGFFHAKVPATRASADRGALEDELRAQIECALAAGLHPSHLDAHMGCAYTPEFIDIYVKLAAEYKIPAMLPQSFLDFDPAANWDEYSPELCNQKLRDLDLSWVIRFDAVIETPWRDSSSIEERYDRFFGRLQEGKNFLALHFNAPGEIEFIDSPMGARTRIDEYEYFRSSGIIERFKRIGATPISFRLLTAALAQD
ncbi:MAG: polysaccharide deacetylase family protein [Verrucomicrobia bacterium]|nr:polysaccharide deacetylase family protein [Verrucomicrobiota bacterium]MBV9298094.1 polysaccharide deacetylase family protein [Verrucomicrobiota bacterium]